MFIKRIVAVGIGGFIGGSGREAIELWLRSDFPIATIIINLSGTFLSAFLVVLLAQKLRWSQVVIDFVLVGILGAFTTYSTAILDMVKLGEFMTAFVYLMITLVGGALVVFLARMIARKVVTL
jgi:CrcB protein